MIKRLVDKYNSSEFIKNVIVVMSGTVIAQIIALVLTPVLARSYSPEDFGYYTTFIAIYAILCSIATGKYERAILLVKKERHIIILSTLGLSISLIFSVLLMFFVFLFTKLNLSFFSTSSLFLKWLYLLPFFILVQGINVIFLTYLNCQKKYKEISKSRVIKTFVSIAFSLICIFFLRNMGGLILGEFIGLFVSTIYLYPQLKHLFRFDKSTVPFFRLFAVRFKNFPIYNIPADLLNNSSNQLPAFFLTSFYGAGTTGQYSLMKRMLDAPVSLLSSSILEVFRQKASEQYLLVGNCRKLFIETAKNLALISILPFSILMIWGTDIFVFLFGNEWVEAGKYAGIFAVFYFFKFVSSPLSYIFYIAEKQRIDFVLHIYMFSSSLVIFYLPKLMSINTVQLFWIYTFNFILIYLTYFVFSYKFSKKK